MQLATPFGLASAMPLFAAQVCAKATASCGDVVGNSGNLALCVDWGVRFLTGGRRWKKWVMQ